MDLLIELNTLPTNNNYTRRVLTPEQRAAKRKTVYGEMQYGIEKTAAELIRDLFVMKNVRIKGNKKKLKEAADKYNVPTTKDEPKILVKGWQGEAKGLLQVLWERGFIDTTKGARYYAKNGTRDEAGIIRPDTNLQELMGNCIDFEEEHTLLQSKVLEMCDRPGQFFLDRSPKCHCELAGDGIEYGWGCGKNYYRGLPLSEKRGKETFKASVAKSISRDILTTERCRKFARRARQYICAYKGMQDGNQARTDLAIDPEMLQKVEQMIKLFKVHRCAMDFDGKFCKQVLNDSDNNHT